MTYYDMLKNCAVGFFFFFFFKIENRVEVAGNPYLAVNSMIVTKEPLELANEGLILTMHTHYVLNKNIVLCLTDFMYTTCELKFTLSKNKINMTFM